MQCHRGTYASVPPVVFCAAFDEKHNCYTCVTYCGARMMYMYVCTYILTGGLACVIFSKVMIREVSLGPSGSFELFPGPGEKGVLG